MLLLTLNKKNKKLHQIIFNIKSYNKNNLQQFLNQYKHNYPLITKFKNFQRIFSKK